MRHRTEAEWERGDSSYMLGDVESVLDNCAIPGEVVKDKRMREAMYYEGSRHRNESSGGSGISVPPGRAIVGKS